MVAFDDSVMAGWLQPGLSSVALPHYEMGRLATDLLIKEELAPAVHLVDMLLRHRDSIGPPAAEGPSYHPRTPSPPTSHDRPLRIPQRRGAGPGRRQR